MSVFEFHDWCVKSGYSSAAEAEAAIPTALPLIRSQAHFHVVKKMAEGYEVAEEMRLVSASAATDCRGNPAISAKFMTVMRSVVS